MQLKDAIESRRSIKHFDPQFKIPEAHVQQMLEHTLLAPTSFNIQHWRILRVEDTDLRFELRAAAFDQAQISEASELFIIAADLNAWSKSPERYWQNTDENTRTAMVSMIQEFYSSNPSAQHDEAIRSGALAAQNLMLSAKALGYDSCPMIGFSMEKVSKLINLPDDHIIVLMLPVGKAERPAHPRAGQLPFSEVVLKNTF